MPQTGTLLLPRDIGAQWDRGQLEELAQYLEQRLRQPVVLGDPHDPTTGVETLARAACERLVIVPFGLLPVPNQLSRWAARENEFRGVYTATPLTWPEWSDWLRRVVLDTVNASAIPASETSVLFVSRATEDALWNANLARLAHLTLENSLFHSISYAFLEGQRPALSEAVRSLSQTGCRELLVIPWLLDDHCTRRLADELPKQQPISIKQVRLNAAHPTLVNLLVSNHCAAFSTESPLPSKRAEDPDEIIADDRLGLQQLEERINSMLPREYQGRYEAVSSKSMGSATLKYDAEGKVAWGEIWTSFCDLALAGGPPHRGTLLEAVTAEEALADPEQYRAVLAEIERGIGLVAPLPVVASRTPGWVGVRCDSEEMAIWLMRALIVENIMVRRERDVLYLPAGPKFTVHREIKNVITSVAKTVHYWTAHLVTRRQLF